MFLKVLLIGLNVVAPGLGTLFMGKVVQGILQLVLEVIGFLCMLTLFLAIPGFIIWAVAWVWALVVGIQWASGRESTVKVRAL